MAKGMDTPLSGKRRSRPPVVTVYEDEGGAWRWRLRLSNNKTFAVSGESFDSKRNAKRAATRLVTLFSPVGLVEIEEEASR